MGWTLPPCRWPFPRLRGVPSISPAGNLSAAGTEPLSSFALRWSITQRSLADRTSGRGRHTDQHLSWAFVPFGTSRIGGPHLASRARPALFRPQGLVTLSAAYALRARAGLVSCRRRPWDLPLRSFLRPPSIRDVTVRKDPRAVSPAVIPAGEQQAGPAGRGFWALTLASVPGD
jgi:hypothetical protein